MFRKQECKQISDLLWDYAAQRLPEANRARVERHLAVCPTCRKEAAAFCATVEQVAMYRQTPVPSSETGWQEVQQRLSAVQPALFPAARRSGMSLAWGLAAVCGIALLLGASAWRKTLSPSPGKPLATTDEFASGKPQRSSLPMQSASESSQHRRRQEKQGTALDVEASLSSLVALCLEGDAKSHLKEQHSVRDEKEFRPRTRSVFRRHRRRALWQRPPMLAKQIQKTTEPDKAVPQKPVMLLASVDGDRPTSMRLPRRYVINSIMMDPTPDSAQVFVMDGIPSPSNTEAPHPPNLQTASATESEVW